MENACENGGKIESPSDVNNVFRVKILKETHCDISKYAECMKTISNLQRGFESLNNIKNGILVLQDRVGTLNSNIFCVKIE